MHILTRIKLFYKGNAPKNHYGILERVKRMGEEDEVDFQYCKHQTGTPIIENLKKPTASNCVIQIAPLSISTSEGWIEQSSETRIPIGKSNSRTATSQIEPDAFLVINLPCSLLV